MEVGIPSESTHQPGTHRRDTARMHAYLAISGLLSLALWLLLLLPNFLRQQGWSNQKIGWAVGSYFLVNLVFQVFSGRIADRHGNVLTALWGTGIALAGGGFYIFALTVPDLIFLARVLHGAGAAMIFAGALLQLLVAVPIHLRGRMIGYYGLPGFVMLGIGPLMAEWIGYRWGFRGVFFTIPVIFLGIAWILLRLTRPIGPKGLRRTPFFESLRAVLPGMEPILAFSICFGLSFSAWNSFIAPAVREMGAGGVSNYGAGYGLGAVFTRLGLSHHLDTGRRRLIAMSTLLAYAASIALIPAAQFPWQLLLLGLVCGMVHGTYYPSLSSLAAERFHPIHTGQALSLYTSASALGMFIGPPIWGALADRWGHLVLFVTAGLLLASGTLVFLVSQRNR